MRRALKLSRLALLATILISPFAVVEKAEGHGTKIGDRILVSESSRCDDPSTTVLTKEYKTKYRVQGTTGASAKAGEPEDHWHYSTVTARLRPYMSNFDSNCLDTRRVCNKIKYYTDTCHRNDRDCNWFADGPADGFDIRDSYLDYWIWIDNLDDCWDEIIY